MLRPLAATVVLCVTLPACAARDVDFPGHELGRSASGLVGTWTALANQPPELIDSALLLTDGTVIGVANEGPRWYRLTPDSTGSYVAGTWSAIASMHDTRAAFGSAVMADGRVFVAGGEVGTGMSTVELYDPFRDVWSEVTSYSGPKISDATAVALPDTRVLLMPAFSTGAGQIYNPLTGAWRTTSAMLSQQIPDEESFAKLPDGTLVAADTRNPFASQKYVPDLDLWVSAGTPPAPLSTTALGAEIGPGVLLYDGRALFIGATNNTDFYTPPANRLDPGTWQAGPPIPNGLTSGDRSAAVMPNGHVLLMVKDTAIPPNPSFFELDPSANPPANGYQAVATLDMAPAGGMLVLPTGEVLFSGQTSGQNVYAPSGSPDPAWRPTIASIAPQADGSFVVTGGLLNGLTEGGYFGDDLQSATDYPLIRLTDGAGVVRYGRSYGFSSMGVGTPTGSFSFIPRAPAGTYSAVVVVNGIASDPVNVTVSSSSAACSDGSRDGDETDVDCGGSCIACTLGASCLASTDCLGALCIGGVCTSSCGDGIRDHLESDVDCGGTFCPPCATGQTCSVASDCFSGVCVGGTCHASTCSDGIQDGSETDVDCGGTTCNPCGDGGRCLLAADCQSAICFQGSCSARLGGSDDLANVTNHMTQAVCSGTQSIQYTGGGSGTAESGLLAGTQEIAPMSRFLSAAACSAAAPAGAPSTAEGLVVGLDGLHLTASQSTAGTSACNGAVADCDPATDPAAGIAWNTTVVRPTKGAYTFTDWRDVLRVLFGGVSHDSNDNGCTSEIRRYLADHWSSFFENPSCASGTCPQLQHVFRPDDSADAAVVFAEILGLSPLPSADALHGFGQSPYCNAMNWDPAEASSGSCTGNGILPHAALHFVGPGGIPVLAAQPDGSALDVAGGHRIPPVVCESGGRCTSDQNSTKCPSIGASCTSLNGITGSTCAADWRCGAGSRVAENGAVWGYGQGIAVEPAVIAGTGTWVWSSSAPGHSGGLGSQPQVAPTSYQDNDPIRRACLGTGHPRVASEDVCNDDEGLGLVVPVPDLGFLSSAGAQAYPSAVTCNNGFTMANSPRVLRCAPAANYFNAGLCPNNDGPTGLGCQVPIGTQADGSRQPQCATINNVVPVCEFGTCAGDGRVYNLSAFDANGQWVAARGVSFMGAFARIHQREVLDPAASPCQFLGDVPSQIACLTRASPCSVGLSAGGGGGGGGVAGTTTLKVNALDATTACVQSAAYPLWHKIYLNTLLGFSSLTGSERNLSQCESNPMSALASTLSSFGFVPLPTTGPNAPTGGNAFCEDLDEQTLCGASTNVNACANNGAGFPTTGTSCGNGRIEALEECDDGSANGLPPAHCSPICRLNQ